MILARCITLSFAILLMPVYAMAAPDTLVAQATTEVMATAGVPKYPISDAQRDRLSALHDQFILDTAQTRANLEVSEHQLKALLSATSVNRQAALSLQEKINALRATLANAGLNLRLATGDVFTAEQKSEFKKRHGHHCGRGPGGGPMRGPGGPCGPGHYRASAEMPPPPPEFGPSEIGFGAPPIGFEAPPIGFEAPPMGFGPPTFGPSNGGAF